jgi:hypothetical protein
MNDRGKRLIDIETEIELMEREKLNLQRNRQLQIKCKKGKENSCMNIEGQLDKHQP